MIEKLTSMILVSANELATEQGIAIEGQLGPDTRLFGEGGLLDSMGLVSLVIAVEQAIQEQFGVSIALADEKALSQRSSPYRTVGALAAYAAHELARGRKNG